VARLVRQARDAGWAMPALARLQAVAHLPVVASLVVVAPAPLSVRLAVPWAEDCQAVTVSSRFPIFFPSPVSSGSRSSLCSCRLLFRDPSSELALPWSRAAPVAVAWSRWDQASPEASLLAGQSVGRSVVPRRARFL
jgi:hypothetical protein